VTTRKRSHAATIEKVRLRRPDLVAVHGVDWDERRIVCEQKCKTLLSPPRRRAHGELVDAVRAAPDDARLLSADASTEEPAADVRADEPI
jgi:hypothetical protein